MSDRDRLAAELQRLVEHLAVLRDPGAGALFTLAEQRIWRDGVNAGMHAIASCGFLTVLLAGAYTVHDLADALRADTEQGGDLGAGVEGE